MNERDSKSFRLLPLLGGLILLSTVPLQAQNLFQSNSGSWHDSGLWSANSVPGASDEVRIGGAALVTGTISTANAVSGISSIGYAVNQAGAVQVQNARTWTVGSDLNVGRSGTGTLSVEGGGIVTNTYGYLGYSASGTGLVTVTGSGSLWQNSASLNIGLNGTGTLDIENGGHVTNTDSYVGSFKSTAVGVVTVTGSDSLWANSTDLNVGYLGKGTLTVQDAGQVTNGTGYIGQVASGSGTATITGADSLWQNSASLYVGYSGSAALNVENGGKVTDTDGYISFSGGTGTATVTGSHSLWQHSGGLTVGYSGTGTLTVKEGGKVADATGSLGGETGGIGVATVTGTGSLWENSYAMSVGGSGKGTLNVESGGQVASVVGYIGSSSTPGNTGVATITGSDSLWTNSDSLSVGYRGEGTLNVQDGGKVTNAAGIVGELDGSSGTATVMGTDSLWQNAAGLSIGRQGAGTLNVQEGGRVSVSGGDTYLGYFASSTGTVTVTGSGSLWENSNDLWLGYFGNGTLNVADGGKVTAASIPIAPFGDGSEGTLNVSGSAGSRGVVETAYLGLDGSGSAGAAIHFDGGVLRATGNQTNFLRGFQEGHLLIKNGGAFIDTNSFDVSIAADFQNAGGQTGGLTKQGAGKLTLAGASTYVGDTIVEQGILWVSGSLASAVMIKAGATLGGAGTVGAVAVENGGIVAPGDGVGVFRTGGETWKGGGSYLWEIGTLTGTAGSAWDLLEVDGTLTLESTALTPFTIAVKGNFAGLDAGEVYEWPILTASGGFDGAFDLNTLAVDLTQSLGVPEGMRFALDADGDTLVLKVSPVPEPSEVILLVTAVGVLLLWRRGLRGAKGVSL